MSQLRSPGASSWVPSQWHPLSEGDYNGITESFPERTARNVRDPENQRIHGGQKTKTQNMTNKTKQNKKSFSHFPPLQLASEYFIALVYRLAFLMLKLLNERDEEKLLSFCLL